MSELKQDDITLLRRRVNQCIELYESGRYNSSHSGDEEQRIDIHFPGSTFYAWSRKNTEDQPYVEVGMYDIGGLHLYILFTSNVLHIRVRGRGDGLIIPRSKIHDDAYLFQISLVDDHHDLCTNDYEKLFRLYDICVELFYKEYS